MAKRKNAPVALIIMDGCGLGGKLDEIFIRLLASDKANAADVHHLGSSDYLRVNKTGKEHSTFLHKCQHSTHHVRTAGADQLFIEPVMAAKDPCIQ